MDLASTIVRKILKVLKSKSVEFGEISIICLYSITCSWIHGFYKCCNQINFLDLLPAKYFGEKNRSGTNSKLIVLHSYLKSFSLLWTYFILDAWILKILIKNFRFINSIKLLYYITFFPIFYLAVSFQCWSPNIFHISSFRLNSFRGVNKYIWPEDLIITHILCHFQYFDMILV